MPSFVMGMIRYPLRAALVEDSDRRGILVRVDPGNTVLVRQHRSCLCGLSWKTQARGVGRSGLSRGSSLQARRPRACAHAAGLTLRIEDSLTASIAFRVGAGRLERRPGKQRPCGVGWVGVVARTTADAPQDRHVFDDVPIWDRHRRYGRCLDPDHST